MDSGISLCDGFYGIPPTMNNETADRFTKKNGKHDTDSRVMKLFIIILHRKLMDEFSLKTRSDEVLVGLNSSQRLLYVPTELVTVYILFRTNFKDRDRFCKPSAAPTTKGLAE